jgi:hypothetical protein
MQHTHGEELRWKKLSLIQKRKRLKFKRGRKEEKYLSFWSLTFQQITEKKVFHLEMENLFSFIQRSQSSLLQ